MKIAKKEKSNTILVVEDEAAYRNALATKFKLAGFSVLEASNGVEGLQLALEKHPDLILLDIMMPKMDGKTMFIELCRDKWGSGVPVIMLSALSDSETIVTSVRDGVTDYLVKGEYKIEDIVKKVKKHLS